MSGSADRDPPGQTLGDTIRALREQRGLSLRALADLVGVSAPFLSDLEHGRRQTDRLEALARALAVPVARLEELDKRVKPELREWLADQPKLLRLLEDLRSSGRPVPVEALRSAARRRR